MRRERLLETELRAVCADGSVTVTDVRSVDRRELAGGQPVRRPQSHAGGSAYAGLFWSATMSDHVPYGSRLELARLWLADFDPGVKRLLPQPFWLSGVDTDGVRRRHVPSLLLERRDGGLRLVDVKHAELARRDEVAVVLTWTGRVCQAAGWSYEVWSGADPTVLANVIHLGRARRPRFVPVEAVDALREVDPGGRSWRLVSDAVRGRLSSAEFDAAAAALLWRGAWATDLTVPLSAGSRLELSPAA